MDSAKETVVGEMGSVGKSLKPGYLSLIPGDHTVEGKT